VALPCQNGERYNNEGVASFPYSKITIRAMTFINLKNDINTLHESTQVPTTSYHISSFSFFSLLLHSTITPKQKNERKNNIKKSR
jgi:hypothetical protein